MASAIDGYWGYYDHLILDNRTAFRQATIKLKRTRRHILEVQTAARELPRKSPYQFAVGANPTTGNLQLIFISHNPLPLEFSAAVGDAALALETRVPVSCHSPTCTNPPPLIGARCFAVRGAPRRGKK